MAVSLAQVNTQAIRVFMGALTNGEAIHAALAQIADEQTIAPHGIALIGGHAVRAIAFAVEFTLTAYDGLPVYRALHRGTGLNLWELTADG